MADRIFCFGDVHFPHHDELALEVCKKAIASFKPTTTVLLGDILDCGMFSQHSSSGVEEVAHSYLQAEIAPANSLLAHCHKNTSKRVVYLEGNHENRVSRWCATKGGAAAQALHEIAAPRVALDLRGAEWIPHTGDQNTPTFARLHRDLVAVHGWSYSKDAASKHLGMSRSLSILFGHTHRAQTEYGRDPWTKRPLQSRSGGCLCKLQPLYLTGGTPSQWIHGFIVGYLGKHSFTLYTLEVNGNSVVMPSGEEIRV